MSALFPEIAELFPQATEAAWRNRVEAVLKGADFDRKLVARTQDGIAIKPLYAAKGDAQAIAGDQAGKPWRIAARVDHPDVDTASAQAREDLEGGADMLALSFAPARAARGWGLACQTLDELDAALAGVQLDLIRLRLDSAPGGRINALMVAALVDRRKLSPAQVAVEFGLDPVGSVLTRGHAPWDWASMAARLPETVKSLSARGFKGPFLSVDLRPYHEAGASEGQELAAALSHAVLYLRALEAHGITLDDAFRAIAFVVPVDADQFMGIAKLRALRLLWARVAGWCGASPATATINAETSWRMLTRRDPHVNILRNTVAAFAAGVGGADSLTVLPYTQPLGLPDAAARRLARNTSLVLQEEANLWRVVDPAAGSGGYEALTEQLAAKAWALFQDIEGEGGLLVSLVLGKLQARIAETAQARMKASATRKEPITGTSEFAHLAEIAPDVLATAPPVPPKPKASRAKIAPDTEIAISALLGGAARGDIQPDASGALEAAPLHSIRLSEPFEALRDRADTLRGSNSTAARATLVTLGPLADHGARLAFMRNFFAAGGIDTQTATADMDVWPGRLLCLVGSDAAYADGAAALAAKLKGAGRIVWLAGRPAEIEPALKEAGVTQFVFMGCDVVACLAEALELTA